MIHHGAPTAHGHAEAAPAAAPSPGSLNASGPPSSLSTSGSFIIGGPTYIPVGPNASSAPAIIGGGGGSGIMIPGGTGSSPSASRRAGSFTLLDSNTQSPSEYREKFKSLQDSCEHLSTYLRRIADSSRTLAMTGSVSDAVQFADELLEFAFSRNDQKDGGLLSHNLKNIGSALKDIETMRSALMEQLENLVTMPLEQFLQVDIKGALEMKKRLVKTRDQYEAAQLKYDLIRTSTKKKKDQTEKAEKVETELAELKKLYELTNINYTNRLNKIDAKKSFEVLERLGTFMYATMSFFHQGYDLLSELEPSLRELMANLDEERKLYLTETLKHDPNLSAGAIQEEFAKHKSREARLSLRSSPRQERRHALEEVSAHPQDNIAIGTLSHIIRRWFVVAEGALHYYRSWKELSPLKTHDMLLSSVKTISETEPPHKNFVFSLVWPTKETMLLQAASDKDRSEWLDVLHNSIAYRLKQSQLANLPHHSHSLIQRPYEQLRNLSEANCYCADCNARNPEWASVNLGALICEECAGAHRGLGVHISRVKSLALDKWEPELLMLLKTIGNAMVNSIWEYNASPSLKPNETSDRDTRERYIKAKYELRRFTQRVDISTDKLQQQLLEAVLESDVVRVYQLLAYGASPDYQDENKRSVLHRAVMEGKTNLFCLELLVQSGAKVNLLDIQERTPLHYAALHDRASAGRLLMNRGAHPKLKDSEGKTPEDLANENNCYNYQSLLTNDELERRKRGSRTAGTTNKALVPDAGSQSAPMPAVLSDGAYAAGGPLLRSGSGGVSTLTPPKLAITSAEPTIPTPTSAPAVSSAAALAPSTPPRAAISPRSSIPSTASPPDSVRLMNLKQALALEISEVNSELEQMKSTLREIAKHPPSSPATKAVGQANPSQHQESADEAVENMPQTMANKLRLVQMLLAHESRPKERKRQELPEQSEEIERESESEDTSVLTDASVATDEEEDEEEAHAEADEESDTQSEDDDDDDGDDGAEDDGDPDDDDDEYYEELDHPENNATPGHDNHAQDEKQRRDGRGGTKDKGSTWHLLRAHRDSHAGEQESGHDDGNSPPGGRSRVAPAISIEGGERKKVGPLSLNSKKVSGEREGKRRSKEMKDDDRDEDHVKKDRSKLKSSSQEKDDDKAPPSPLLNSLPFDQRLMSRQDGKSLGDKVKGWARRKGSSVKRRGSEEIVYVNHNPIHNFIKINANVKEKEDRERELAELVKSS